MITTAERVLDKLKEFDLKDEGSGQYRCNSPLRPGSNSHAFHLKIEGGEFGTYIDHARTGDPDSTGSLYDLAQRLGIPTPEGGAAVADTKRAYRDLEDYASAHGTTADTLRKAGWRDVEQVKDGGKTRPALPFKTATGERYRFIDGEKPTYKSAYGYKPCWYGLAGALKLADDSWFPLVLCNGEASTVVAQSYGIPAACVTSGEKKYPPALVDELKAKAGQRDILIAMDCDKTGREAAQAIKAQLAGMKVIVVDLKLGDKGDLADFCMLYGSGAPQKLAHLQSDTPVQETPQVSVGIDLAPLAAAVQQFSAVMRLDAATRKQQDIERLCAEVQAQLDRVRMQHAAPQVLSFADVALENLQELDWVLSNPDSVQGLRSNIPTLDKAIGGFPPEIYNIYGATGMGKSWFAVSLAREFIKQAPGVIVSTESIPKRWQRRLASSITRISFDKIETGDLTPEEAKRVREAYQYLATLRCGLLKGSRPTPAQVRAATLRAVEEYGIKWLIVDSASNMSAPGMTAMFDVTKAVSNALQDLYVEANIPIFVTTQVGRDVAERGEGKKMPQLEDGYGGGVIEHDAGVVLALYRHHYYVEKGTEKPRPADFPENMTLVRILKNRWRLSGPKAVKLNFLNSSGFYEMETHYAG